jgi:HSP20 family protein
MFYPFEELRRIQERMNRLFDEFERLGFGNLTLETPVDVIDEGDAVRVIIDIPGFRKEDIEIYMEDSNLIVRAVRREESSDRKGNYIRRERRYGEVYRRIKLPEGLDVEKAKANYNNGVLEIIIPRSEKARKKIKLE